VLRRDDPSFDVVSASDVGLTGPSNLGPRWHYSQPRPLTLAEIDEYVHMYETAAKNAVRAGFDGVELHGERVSPTTVSFCCRCVAG
jgi:NADPH2 dehydrogenase